MSASSRTNRRKLKKKRSNTLDPSVNLSTFASSVSPSRANSKLRPKTAKGRPKSKSPSGFSTKDKKARKKKRSSSDVMGQSTSTKSMQIRIIPIDDLTPINDDELKKQTMKPVTSLSATAKATSFGSDDDLNSQHSSRPMSARYSSKENISTNSMQQNVSSSKCISTASKRLHSAKQSVAKQINGGFESFRNALDEQQNTLLTELESVYDKKKDALSKIEKKLYENTKRSKNAKSKEYDFDANVKLVMDKERILQQIKHYGYIEGAKRSEHTSSDSVVFHEDNLSQIIEGGNDEVGEGEDDLSHSMAVKQKAVLKEIQNKTMDKLDLVILMEKEAKKKAKQAAILTKEVDASLKYIDERTKIINEKILAAKPELDKARIAVDGIDAKELNEIKSLKSPPIVIENVITATVMILGILSDTVRPVTVITKN